MRAGSQCDDLCLPRFLGGNSPPTLPPFLLPTELQFLALIYLVRVSCGLAVRERSRALYSFGFQNDVLCLTFPPDGRRPRFPSFVPLMFLDASLSATLRKRYYILSCVSLMGLRCDLASVTDHVFLPRWFGGLSLDTVFLPSPSRKSFSLWDCCIQYRYPLGYESMKVVGVFALLAYYTAALSHSWGLGGQRPCFPPTSTFLSFLDAPLFATLSNET